MSTTKPAEQLFGREHVQAYRETDGEHGYRWKKGTTILLLNTKGRKSGETRTTPLIHRAYDDGRWVVIASRGGHPEHPDWYENLLFRRGLRTASGRWPGSRSRCLKRCCRRGP